MAFDPRRATEREPVVIKNQELINLSSYRYSTWVSYTAFSAWEREAY